MKNEWLGVDKQFLHRMNIMNNNITCCNKLC